MTVDHPLARELAFKIVLYGPGLSGKTSILDYVYRTTSNEHRGKLVSLSTPADRTLVFDYLPIKMPPIGALSVRLQLFTVPGQVRYDAARKMVLTAADGLIVVGDSQRSRMDANLESLHDLEEHLLAHGRSLDEMPHVLLYNKRDVPDPLPLEAMENQLNRLGAPSFAACASSGEGIYEALEAVTRAILEDLPRRAPEWASSVALFDRALPEESWLAAALCASATPDPAEAPISEPGAGWSPQDQKSGFSFELLWPPSLRLGARSVEAEIEVGNWRAAILQTKELVQGLLSDAFDPTWVKLNGTVERLTVSGIEPQQWLAFEAVVNQAERGGRELESKDALLTYLFALRLSLARGDRASIA